MFRHVGYVMGRIETDKLRKSLDDFIYGDGPLKETRQRLDKGYKYFEKNELKKALEEFDRGVKSDNLSKISYEIRVAKGQVLNLLNQNHDDVIDLMNEALRIVDRIPIFHYISETRGQIWLEKAEAHYLKMEYDLALRCAKIAINFMPDSPVPWFAQGVYLMGKQNFISALESFETAIYLEESFKREVKAIEFEYRGLALMELGRTQEANSCFQEVLRLDSENKTALEKMTEIEKQNITQMNPK